jgi:hypothetical protein
MADKTEKALSDVLVQAKMSLDEALTRIEAGEDPGTLTAAQMQKIRPDATVNPGCSVTNTGCPGLQAR